MDSIAPDKILLRRFRKKAKKIDALLLEIELIKEQIKQIKNQVSERLPGHLRRIPIDKAERLFNKMYWASETLSWSVITSFRSVLPGQTVDKTKDFKFPCERCGNTTTVSIASWADYKRTRPAKNGRGRQWPKVVCKYCDDEQKEEDRESAIKTEAWWQERQRQIAVLRSMPYTEYLNTIHWDKVRLRKLKQAGFHCQLCNSKQHLQVHHRTYERRGYEWLADLIVLCQICHQKFHNIVDQSSKTEES